MTQVLRLTRDNPIVHIKAYAGVKIEGVDQPEITCEIDAPQLVTMVEDGDHVYITVNSSCRLTVPALSSLEIERAMGSAKIANIKNPIRIEKVFGNLVLLDISEAFIGKVGGNFSVQRSDSSVKIEKVGGNLIVADVGSFRCEKIGGSCKVRQVHGDFILEKAGGNIKAQDISGVFSVKAVGGSFFSKNVYIGEDLRVGGNIRVIRLGLGKNGLTLKAGGDINVELDDDFAGALFKLNSGAEDIRIKHKEDDLKIHSGYHAYQIGNADQSVVASAGGSIIISELIQPDEDIIGDLSEHFDFEETRYSEMIQERIETATRFAEAKVRSAEIRLDQMRNHLEKNKFNFENDAIPYIEPKVPPQPPKPLQPVPPVARPVGKRGASDEERLMILKMLQDKKINVDEAEILFKALED